MGGKESKRHSVEIHRQKTSKELFAIAKFEKKRVVKGKLIFSQEGIKKLKKVEYRLKRIAASNIQDELLAQRPQVIDIPDR
jgi:hypothetical protein